MNLELTDQEVSLVLDSLSNQPLRHSYGLFNKIMALYQAHQQQQQPVQPPELNNVPPDSTH